MGTQNDLFTLGPFGQKPLKEQVTPHKMSVIVLIQEYSTMKRAENTTLGDDSTLEIKFSEKEKRNFMITVLQLLQASDITLKELCLKIRDKMKPELYTMFQKKLQEFMDEGVGAIKDYFQNIMFLLVSDNSDQPVITKSSVFGLFIRRMILAFEKLSFSQMTDLYAKFQRYYEAANLEAGCEESQDFGGSLTDSAMSLSGVRFSRMGRSLDAFQLTGDRKLTEDFGGFNSQRQAEYFILQQVFLLQHNQNEALSPSDLQDKIMDMLKADPDMAEAHFLSYLNSLRVKEYCTAVHNLFHYFDRKTSSSIDPNQSAQQNKPKDEEVHRRYAALNLASLHYRFGHKEEAKAALREAIGMAQDTNDNVCLQHALGWLHRLSEQGTARTENLLERAVAKSNELNLPNLTSIGIQAYARHNAFATARPSQVFEYLQKSDVLNCQHSQAGFMCTSFANKAALWQMYGKRECLSMMSQLILHLDTAESGVYFNGESICIALCNIARLHADCGQYGLALDIINSTKKRFPKNSPHSEIWMNSEQEILFDRTILNRKFGVTDLAVLNLKAFSESEAELRSAILNRERGETTAALTQLHHLMDMCNSEKGDNSFPPDFRCRVLLAVGELYSQTGNHTNATSYILECITIATRHHLEYLGALASVQLAYIQLQMQLPEQSLVVLTKNMLPVLSHGTLCDKGRLLCCYAKCQVAMATKLGETDRKTVLLSSVNLMNTVIELFQSAEAFLKVKDAVYYQARLYHDLGYVTERNRCAHQFKQLDSQYPTLSRLAVNVL